MEKRKRASGDMTPEEMAKIRHRLRLSQTEFGEMLGYKNGQVAISRLETGAVPITARTAISVRMLYDRLTKGGSIESKAAGY